MKCADQAAVLLVLVLLCPSPTWSFATSSSHLGAGLKLFEQERYVEASKEFDLALRQDPNLTEARYYLAVSYFKQKEYKEAREQFEPLLSLAYKKDWVVYYMARLDLNEGLLNSAIRRFNLLSRRSEPLQDEFYYLGSAFMKKGEPAKAAAPLLRQIAFNSRDFRAHYLLARVYMKLGQPGKAEQEFKESENLHRYYSKGQTQLVGCSEELKTGHVDDAWKECGAVLKTSDIDKLVAVGMLFGKFHHYDYALQAFQKALSLDPDSPEVNYDLGFTYFQNENYPMARRFLDSAIRLRPDFFEALTADGAVLYTLGRRSEAAKVLQRARALRPENHDVNDLLERIGEAERRSDE